jgi:hypothetical protein
MSARATPATSERAEFAGKLFGDAPGRHDPAGYAVVACSHRLSCVAAVAQRVLPHVSYWPSTPWGGELPFRVRTGTSHYFGVGRIGRDQVADFARRTGLDLPTAARWLAPNLAYDRVQPQPA